jgi:hypothetical protein
MSTRDGACLSVGGPRFVRLRATWALPATWRRVHATLTIFWFLAIIPTVLWWRDSVFWVALLSCYANAAGHFAAWQGSRAEDNATPSDSDDPGPS